MSDIPVPDPGKGPPIGGPSAAHKTLKQHSIAASSDPIEAPVSRKQEAIDSKKLEILNFEHQSKVTAFRYVLFTAAILFVCGAAMFCEASRRMFGWQTILILIAFFAPATIILTFLIRAVFSASGEKKEDAKKDDLSDMVPSAAVIKLIAELMKPK